MVYEYLGFTQIGARISVTAFDEDVHVDLSGPRVAFDNQWMGQEATVVLDLIKYNEPVMNRLRAQLLGLTEGQNPANTIGSLRVLEGLSFSTFINCPYNVKPQYSTMNPCWNFPITWPTGPIEEIDGTRVKVTRVTLRAINAWNGTNGAGILYTRSTPGGLPPVN